MPPTNLDELLCTVATWDREQLIRQFTHHESRFPIDFTPDFYQTQSVERLRHIFVAVCIQNRQQQTKVA